MSILVILLALFAVGAGIALIVVGLPAIIKLSWAIARALYALFILLPWQIIRVIQGKPAVKKKA